MRGSSVVEVVGDLGPGADPDPVGLRDAAVLEQRARRRLLVGPDALLERAAQLGVVGGTNEVVALVVEGRVEEEPLVLELEVLVLLANSALAQGDELLALGERAHCNCPFLEGNWHVCRSGVGDLRASSDAFGPVGASAREPRRRSAILGDERAESKYVTKVGHLAVSHGVAQARPWPPPPGVSIRRRSPGSSSPSAFAGSSSPFRRLRPGAPSSPPGRPAARAGGAR